MTSGSKCGRARCRGFTLMELAVVLMIVGLLLGGLLMPLSTQRDVDSIRTTAKSLADIREALIGFAITNGRLPCPAQATLQGTNPSGANYSVNAGFEATTGTGAALTCACVATTTPGVAKFGTTACSPGTNSTDTVGGVLPWATLGLLETDAWSNRYTYHVNVFFARGVGQTLFGCAVSSNPANAAFALCEDGSIVVYTDHTKTVPLTNSPGNGAVPAIVVSHGKSALGAYSMSGTQITAAAAGTDEYENSNGDANFVSNFAIDDQLVWVPTSLLMSRMLAAGKLP